MIAASDWLDTIDDESKALDVSNQSLADQLGSAIVRALPSSVLRLNLKGNSFSSQTEDALAALLQRNTSLQHISLDSNPLNTGSDGLDSFIALTKSLEENTTLRSLSLFRCGIGKKGCAVLAQAMQKNSTLISLELGDRNICDESDLHLIKEKLSQNRNLYEEQLSAKARADESQRKAAQQKLQEEDVIQKEKDTLEWLEAEKATREESRRAELERQRIKELEEHAYKERMDQIHKMEEERKASKKKKKKKGKGKKKKK